MANLVRKVIRSDRNAARQSVMPAVVALGWTLFILRQGLTAQTWYGAVICFALVVPGLFFAFVLFRWNRQARAGRVEQDAGLELIRDTRSKN